MTNDVVKVLGFAGSLRQASFNRALLRAAQEMAPATLQIEIFDLVVIPFYNADVEAQGDPEPVRAFKDAIRLTDAVLIATPEYNYGIPGILKNAIDWASRPAGKSVLRGKVVAIMGASPSMTGTARAQEQVRQAIHSCGGHAVPLPEVLVSSAPERFDPELRLKDERSRQAVTHLLDALLTLAKGLRVSY